MNIGIDWSQMDFINLLFVYFALAALFYLTKIVSGHLLLI